MADAREVIATTLREIAEDVVPCMKCKGYGYHHWFGEHGHDPDWCSVCGGPGSVPKHDATKTPELILSALSAAGLKVVGLKPSKAALKAGAQALIDSQPHNGVAQLAVFPAYEIWFAMVHAYDAAPPATTQGEKT